jgi:outer membrane protein TolC
LGYAFQNTNVTYPSIFTSLGPAGASFLNSYYQVSPVISLSMPLIKNFGGSQTAAGVHKVQYQLEAAEKGAAFGREQLLHDSKVAYWNLALAQESVRIRRDTLERSRKIWEWTKKRVKRNLAETPDGLEAESSVRLAELDLQMALEKEKTARLDFNRYRNKKGADVPEELETLENSLDRIKADMPETLNNRLDLAAAQDTVNQQKAAYDEANANVYPDITVNASYRGNGVDPNFSPANQTAFSFNYPTWNVGAQFNLPLDVFTSATVAEGYKRNYDSALLSLKDKQLEVGQEWAQLKTQLQDVNRRLDMTAEIEEIQKHKADEEKKRLEYGRTTEFQLLSFENDYNAARLNRLAVVFEKLSVLAQAQWWLATDVKNQGANQ